MGFQETLCKNPTKAVAGLCKHNKNLLPALYHEALSRARRDHMGGGRHHPGEVHRIGPPVDYSTDAIIYVTVVILFYAIIIVLLLIPKRTAPSRRNNSGSSSSSSSHHPSTLRKHWLFFNPISGEAQQATRKESAYFCQRQDAETV